MSAQTTTWAQAIEKVLQSSENEWLTPNEILQEIRSQNLKETCSTAPICSIKKILYKNTGPFIWDKVKHRFALKTRVGDNYINGQLGTPQADGNNQQQPPESIKENKDIKAPSRNNELPEENTQSEDDFTPCYESTLGYVVTITPTLSDNNDVIEHNNKSPPRLTLSPITHAFPKRCLQYTRTKPCQSKQSEPSCHVASITPISIMEYDRLLEANGGTCVAILANQLFQPRNVDAYEYDPSQSEESIQPPSDSKEMESSKGDVDGSDKSVKKTPPSGGKKRSTEKRKISDDSSLTSVNIKSSLTMENFVKLSKENKQKVINLLPVIDRCDEYTPTPSAFNNTFFNSACREWQQLLQAGQLSMSQRAKQKLEEASRNKMVDEWKKQHFEEELSQDTPPQDPRSKLFYPVPLSGMHQRVIDCIKKVCQGGEDAENSSAIIVNGATPDRLSDESITVNSGSHEQCTESHDVYTGSHETCTESHEPCKVLDETDIPSPEVKQKQDDKTPHVIDININYKLSLEVNGDASSKSNEPHNGGTCTPEQESTISPNSELPEQCKSCMSPKPHSELTEQSGSNVSPKQACELIDHSKNSPERLSIQNIKLLDKSPEQVDRSHDQNKPHNQNCVSPVDKGRQLEQDGKFLSRSFEQDIERANLSLKLQINKLCQQQLLQYKKLEQLNKSTEQRLMEGATSPTEDKSRDMKTSHGNSNLNNRCRKRINKSYIKPSIIKFNPSLSTTEANCGSGGDKECGINLCLINDAVTSLTNHVSKPSISALKRPTLFDFRMPLKYEIGAKRRSMSTTVSLPDMKKSCNDTRADFLTTLPAAFMYSDIIAELKRRSKGYYAFPSPACRQPTKNWQLLHTVYHDHNYATDYVPLASTASEEQSSAVCDNCAGEPLLICMNCGRCVHKRCVLPGCTCCKDCLNTHGVIPLV